MTNLGNALQLILNAIVQNPLKCAAALAIPLLCLATAAVADPKGAVNTFMLHMVDATFSVWPSTPPNMKIGYLVAEFIGQVPLADNFYVLQTLSGVTGILAIVIFFKVLKSLPFY